MCMCVSTQYVLVGSVNRQERALHKREVISGEMGNINLSVL